MRFRPNSKRRHHSTNSTSNNTSSRRSQCLAAKLETTTNIDNDNGDEPTPDISTSDTKGNVNIVVEYF